MSTFQVAFNNTTKTATVQPDNDALPVGSINIGTFDHVSDDDDQLGGMDEVPDNHVIYHHVRELLYKRSAANPAQLAMFPDNITDMAGTTIVMDSVANPLPLNTVIPAITGTAQEDEILTTTNGTWSGTPLSYVRQWKRANAADGTGAVTNVGTDALTYTAVTADVGKYIFCEVIATNANGAAVTAARSNVVGPVLAT